MSTNRIILRILYNGTLFQGFQRQPHVRTVEGVIEKELVRQGCIESLKEASYAASGRTDKGVSALSQTIVLETQCSIDEVVKYINKYKPLIYAWAKRIDYSGEFNPRYWAIYREYMYVHKLTPNYSMDKVLPKIGELIGCKDFSFLKLPKDTNPYRCVFKIKIRIIDNYVVYNIVADSFARQMVRRMVFLLKSIAEDKRKKIGLMPPQNLLLLRVRYPYTMCIDSSARRELVEVIKDNSRRVVVFDLLYRLYFSSSSSWIYEFS